MSRSGSRIKLPQGRLDFLGSGRHPQGLESFDEFRLFLGDRLAALARLAGLPSLSIEEDRLAVCPDAGLPDFQAPLLQFQVKNRTLI